jgi:hypothetical protein
MSRGPSADESEAEFERESEQADIGFLAEFVCFLRENKKWWLVPLIGSLLLLGVVSLLAASGAAPFIYTVF